MKSNSDTDISEQIKNWNPMRDAYNDSSFNKYMTGPGAELDEGLHQQTGQRKYKDDPYLVFKYVPENLTLNGLLNICSTYGKALHGRKHENMYFVNFASLNDMERVFTGLQQNSYGFRVQLGNRVKKNPDTKQSKAPLPDLPPFPANSIDYDRSYQTSSRNPPRPIFRKKPFVTKEHYDDSSNFLNVVDPQRHFLIEDDAHALERLDYCKKVDVRDGKYNVHTGRAYYVMPKNDREFIAEKQKTTKGYFDSNLETFLSPSPVIEKVKSGPCESCQKLCVMICSRCSAFFCSTECQVKEWQKHRYVCGKPLGFVQQENESLSDQEDLTSKASDQDEETWDRNSSSPRDEPSKPNHHDSTQQAALQAQLPTSGSKVKLTAISKTNVVFVRSMAFDDNLEFFKIVSIVQKEAKFQRCLQHTPQRGDIVLVKFKEDQYNRAMVLNPDDLDHIKLIYIDYGNIDSRPLDQLLDAPDEFWYLPRMAMPIILQNLPDFFMTDEVKKYMYSHLNADMKIVYKPEDMLNGIHQAELFNLESNESFNKKIASLKGPISESDKASVVFKDHLQSLPLPDGENVELIVLDNSLLQTAFVSCTTEDYALQIQKFQDDIQAHVKLNPRDDPYTPRINELCIAKYDEDNLWYRGRCIERVGDGHPSILFFDYGNISIVSVDNIRPYPEEFTFPIMTGDCEINGLPEKIDDDLKKRLEDELPVGTKIVCDKVVKYADDNFYSIYLKNLLENVLN